MKYVDSLERRERIEQLAWNNNILHQCLAYAESLHLGWEIAMELAVCFLVEENTRLESDLLNKIQRNGASG